MRYTLDSIDLVIKALQEKYPDNKYESIPFITEDISSISLKQENRLYYGVLTNGASTIDCDIYLNTKKTITIDPNSQIEILFDQLFSTHDATSLSNMHGQFRGHFIYVV